MEEVVFPQLWRNGGSSFLHSGEMEEVVFSLLWINGGSSCAAYDMIFVVGPCSASLWSKSNWPIGMSDSFSVHTFTLTNLTS